MPHRNHDHDLALEPSPPPARWALASLSLAVLLSSLGSSVANIALPTLAESFAVELLAVQWVVLAYLIAMTASMVIAGGLGDLIGRRRLLALGLAVLMASSVVSAVAPSLWLLVVARAAQGIGAAIAIALALAFVGDIVPKAKTGSAMGLLGTMSAVGTALGPSLGGALIIAFGWRSIFLVNVPLGAVAVVLALRHLPRDRPAPIGDRLRFGRVGALLAPFRDQRLRASLIANLLVSTVLMATLVVGPFHLSRVLGLDAALVGGVMSIGPIVAAVLGVPAGRMVDRLGAQRMIRFGLGGIAIGASCLALLPEALGIPGYVVPVVVITASYAVFQAANNTAIMGDARPDQRGVISGTLSLSRNLGLIGGTSLMGAVFAVAGMHVTFALAAGLIGVALAVVMSRAPVAARPAARAY